MDMSRIACFTSAFTASLHACGLMKTNARLVPSLGVSSNGSPPSFCAILSVAGIDRSSSVSKIDLSSPSTSTCESLVHALSTSFLMPARSSDAPVGSSSRVTPSQFIRSAMPSNALALACTPLSPVVGRLFSPSASQRWQISRRIEPSAAASGSVAPSTDPRNSAHESTSEFHWTEK